MNIFATVSMEWHIGQDMGSYQVAQSSSNKKKKIIFGPIVIYRGSQVIFLIRNLEWDKGC